jgi:hypothetical protein
MTPVPLREQTLYAAKTCFRGPHVGLYYAPDEPSGPSAPSIELNDGSTNFGAAHAAKTLAVVQDRSAAVDDK